MALHPEVGGFIYPVSRPLDELRERFGADGPDLVIAVQSAPPAQLDDVAEALLERRWEPQGDRPPNEVWPLVNARTSTFTTGGSNQWYTGTAGPAGLNLVAAIDPRTSGTGRFPSGVLRALLYSHGLVIEDPLLMAAELYAGTAGEARALARTSVEAAVASTVEIASLIDAGVVETFFTPSDDQGDAAALAEKLMAALDEPGSRFSVGEVWDAFEAGYVDGLSPPLRELWAHVRSGDRSPPLDLISEAAALDLETAEVFIRVLTELRPRGVVENTVSVVAGALTDIARSGARADLLCPSRLFAELAFVGSADPRHAVRLHQLAEIDVPQLDELLVEDAVHIRQQSESFARWRHALSAGLERAHQLQAELGPDVDATGVIAELLTAARQDIAGEVSRSAALGANQTLVSFVAGGLGGALGGVAGGTAGATLGAAGGIVGPLAQAATHRGIRGFVRRHYVLFERPPAASR